MIEATMPATPPPPGEVVGTADQRVVLHGVPWSHYEVLLALRGESAMPRLTYLRGDLEIMSPSLDHERIKKMIARLLETWALATGTPLDGYGSWTVRSAPSERGLEPDECYVLGARAGKERPDLAVEVMWTSGSLDKLAVYSGLGVPEVWFWRDGHIEVWVLDGDGYERAEASRLLPRLDLALISRFLGRDDQTQAAREYYATLVSPETGA